MLHGGVRDRLDTRGGLFEPNTILPTQFHDQRHFSVLRSEGRLLLAVLEDAVRCFQKYALASDNRGRVIWEHDLQWFAAGDDDGYLFAFEIICELLALDASYLRRGLYQRAVRFGVPP